MLVIIENVNFALEAKFKRYYLVNSRSNQYVLFFPIVLSYVVLTSHLSSI